MKTFSRIALGFGISLLVSGAAILLLVPGSERIAGAQAVVGLAATIFYFVANKGSLGRTFSDRAVWFYGLSAGIGVVLIGALVATNYISVRKAVSWDLTKGGLFTLAEDTVKTLEGLKEEVKVTAFYGSAEPAVDTVKEILERYQRHSDLLKVEFVDPEKNPQLTSEKSITANGPRIIFSRGSTEARANDPSEESLTNALLKVLRTSEKTVYFTAGHGEGNIADSSGERGFARIAKKLEDEGLKSSALHLTSGEVPADAAAVAILGPQRPFLEVEVAALRSYLDEGGRLFVALEPGSSDPGLEQLLEERGLIFEDSIIVDPMSKLMGGGDAVPVVQQYAEHEITRSFGLMSVFPSVRPVIAKGDAEPRPTILALSNPSAWGETEWRTGTARLDETKRRGPLGVIAVVSSTSGEKETRIVAAGDSDFVNNQYQGMAGNADLFLNSMNWLASQEARITIRPKQREASRLLLTDGDARFLNFFSISAMPMLILAAGLSVWLVRRSK